MSSDSEEIKLSPPEYFDGTKSKLITFERQLALYFAGKPKLYGDDIMESNLNRILFALSYMRGGRAEEWANEFIDRAVTSGNWGTWEEFHAQLQGSFRDANACLLGQHCLESMKQGSHPAEDYFIAFDAAIRQAGYNEETHGAVLIHYLEQNLNSTLVDRIYDSDPFLLTYKDWKNKAIILDQLHHH